MEINHEHLHQAVTPDMVAFHAENALRLRGSMDEEIVSTIIEAINERILKLAGDLGFKSQYVGAFLIDIKFTDDHWERVRQIFHSAGWKLTLEEKRGDDCYLIHVLDLNRIQR